MTNYLQEDTLDNCLSKVIDYRGKTPKKLGGDWSSSGYRAISAKNVKFDGLHNLEEIRFLSDNLYKKWMKEEVRKGDILLTSEAPAGQVMVWDSDEKIVLSQRLYGLRVSEKIDNWFLKYYLQSATGQNEIIKNNSGSTVFGISAQTFKNIVVRYPDKKYQTLIGRLLSRIDKKIVLNNKINADLEQLAKTIYDYWFVQYDFPDENGQPYKSSGGKMVWSESLKREIPDGWKSLSLASLIGESKNGDWGSEAVSDGSTKCFCVRGADIDGLNGIENFNPPIRYIDELHNNRQLKPDDLIIEISGGSPTQSTGRMAHISSDVLNRLGNKVVCSNFCKAISLKNQKLSYIISRFWTHLYDSKVFFNHEGKTSGIKNLLFDQLSKDVKAAIPSDVNLIKKYYEFEEKNDRQKQNNLQQNEELVKLRDWLLPMLMNGQVKIIS